MARAGPCRVNKVTARRLRVFLCVIRRWPVSARAVSISRSLGVSLYMC